MLWGLLACTTVDEGVSPELLEVAFQAYEGRADRPVGGAVYAVGDLDGDGREDLALAWPHDTASLEGGSTTALLTASSSVSSPYAMLSSSSWVVSEGECSSPRVHGYTNLVGLGDLDGDGLGELAVGFPGAAAGEVGVFLGSRLAEGGELGPEDATWRILGGTGAWSFGQDLVVGDFDGDGVPDLGLSAPKTDSPLYAGEVYAVLGARLLQEDPGLVAATSLGGRVESPWSGLQFGERLAVVPDVDGDGSDELAVLASGCSQVPEEGFLVVVPGAELLDGSSELDDLEALWSEPRTFRLNLVHLGDADGDGRGDLALGGVPDGEGGTRVLTFAGEHLARDKVLPVGEIEVGADSGSQLVSVAGPTGVELVGHDGGYVVRVPYPLTATGWYKQGWVAPCLDQTNEGWMKRLAVGDFDGDGQDELAVGEPAWPACDSGVLDQGVVGLVELD